MQQKQFKNVNFKHGYAEHFNVMEDNGQHEYTNESVKTYCCVLLRKSALCQWNSIAISEIRYECVHINEMESRPLKQENVCGTHVCCCHRHHRQSCCPLFLHAWLLLLLVTVVVSVVVDWLVVLHLSTQVKKLKIKLMHGHFSNLISSPKSPPVSRAWQSRAERFVHDGRCFFVILPKNIPQGPR